MPKKKKVANIEYILGENAIENHKIIRESNPDYWWFHLDNCNSGHCIVCSDKIDNNIMNIAGNFIKKYSKLKNQKKVTICYTQISNLILLDVDGMVEFYNDINTFECFSTKIYHYSNFNGGCASEYIIPNDTINITIHGIGTGIYGITKKQKKGKEFIFTLENPLILYTDIECNNYSKASITLNENLESNKNLDKIVEEFCILLPKLNKNIIIQQLKIFKADYKNRKDIVMSPINYILMGHSYDGIYSRNTYFDNLNTGNIKFTNYPTKKNKLCINYLKRRNKTNEYIDKIN